MSEAFETVKGYFDSKWSSINDHARGFFAAGKLANNIAQVYLDDSKRYDVDVAIVKNVRGLWVPGQINIEGTPNLDQTEWFSDPAPQ